MLQVGGTYYAYSTNTGGPSLPVMSSTNLVTWVARPAYDPGPPLDDDPWFNDALPRPARWARYSGGTRPRVEVWAPGVGQFGSTFVAFYAVRVSPVRMCISRATSSSPLGPFVDDSSRPLVCDADPAGSGRPADGRGRAYWTGLLAGGRVSRGEVMTGFSESGEYRSAMAAEVTVAMTYMGMLRRAPDRSGYAHWVAMLEAGGDRGALVGSVFGSREYASRLG
ncbi:MAG: DUF4214 domain-containing protein [Actinomycetota bacterium]|nr:DUF4214 domain-containing protein [Actinomycetota bacterium]